MASTRHIILLMAETGFGHRRAAQAIVEWVWKLAGGEQE